MAEEKKRRRQRQQQEDKMFSPLQLPNFACQEAATTRARTRKKEKK